MRRPLWLVCALVALVTVTASGPALATPVARTAATPANVASANTQAPAVRGVTLVTGDSVRVTKDAKGRTIVQGLPATRRGVGAAFQTVTTPKHTYVFPASARPYLGRFLDPTLFDVTTLSAGAGAGARIPVRLTFTGTAVPAMPGVTVTSSAAGAASGYLTPASARRFGAALAAQYLADAKAGFPKQATLFGATKVFADVSVPPVVRPLYPMRTLIIKVLDSAGAPVPFGFVNVYNTDSFAKFFNFAIVQDGEASSRLSALTILNPPRCSLDSTNGPSVVTTSPPVASTTVAVDTGWSPPPKTQLPEAMTSWLNLSTCSYILSMSSGDRSVSASVLWTDSRYWTIVPSP
jgi:hypothetical protein